MKLGVPSLASLSGLRIQYCLWCRLQTWLGSCGVGRRHGSDPVLLWLWRRPAAIALIQPLAWEPSYAAGVGLKRRKTKDKKKKKKKKDEEKKRFADKFGKTLPSVQASQSPVLCTGLWVICGDGPDLSVQYTVSGFFCFCFLSFCLF